MYVCVLVCALFDDYLSLNTCSPRIVLFRCPCRLCTVVNVVVVWVIVVVLHRICCVLFVLVVMLHRIFEVFLLDS